MSQFVSALELATYFNGTTEVGDLTPEFIAQADLLLEMISADVESAAGFPIEAASIIAVLPGTWSRDLILPAGPVRAVTSVAVNDVAVPASGWTWNDASLIRRGGDAFDTIDADDFGDDWSTLGMQGAGWQSGGHWGGPASTLKVAYGVGFLTAVPDIVRSLVFRIAARTFGNVGAITSESLGVYSVSYGKRGITNDGSHVTKAERKRLRRALGGIVSGTANIGGR